MEKGTVEGEFSGRILPEYFVSALNQRMKKGGVIVLNVCTNDGEVMTISAAILGCTPGYDRMVVHGMIIVGGRSGADNHFVFVEEPTCWRLLAWEARPDVATTVVGQYLTTGWRERFK